MLLIVAHHYVVNSGLATADGVIYSNPSSWRSIFLLLFGAWGKTGINCFVLITGYFMCKSQITLMRFAKLLLEIYLYRVTGYIVFLLAGYETVSIVRIMKLLLPITSVNNDFTSCYLVFFLCITFANILIHNMTERQHVCLLSLMIIVYTVIGSIPQITVTLNYVTWFGVLYLLSSYSRLYPKKLFSDVKFWGWTCLTMLFLASLSVVALFVNPIEIEVILNPYMFVSDSNKIFAVAVAFSSFMFFRNLKLKSNRFINAAASTTFGVLLIHANSDAIRTWLWKDTLNNVGMYSSPYLVLHAVGSVICIFAVCSAIDYLRITFIEKPFFNKCWDKIDNKLTKLGHQILNKIVPTNGTTK